MRILVAYDGSIHADTAVEDLQRAGFPEESVALILCVSDGDSPDKLAEAETLAEIAANRLQSFFPKWEITAQALSGSPAKTILDASRSWEADLIVVGSHGRSPVGRALMGSVSLELVHHAPCSVRVARGPILSPSGEVRIVVGDDGSPEAEVAIRAIANRTWPKKTVAHVVSVSETLVPATELLAASTYSHEEQAFATIKNADREQRIRIRHVAVQAASSLRCAGLAAETNVVDGDPREEILAEAARWSASVIFVGARGLGRMERFLLGSVSTHIVTHAKCSVEVVR